MLKITDELIDRFLKGLCTKEESKAIEEYFRQNPADKFLLDDFEHADNDTPLPPGYREEMLGFIEAETKPALQEAPTEEPGIGRIRPLRRWSATAAAIILAAVAVYLLRTKGKSGGVQQAGGQLASVSWIDQFNPGDKGMNITLPDSSRAKLSPGAHIRYRKDFGHYEKREILVEGTAWFQVAKNEQMPFVVNSDGLATTALGTAFDVTAIPGATQIKVKLYDGKVLVSLGELAAGSEKKEYYLRPGQEFVFDKHSRNVAINEFGKQRSGEAMAAHGKYRTDTLSNWYMFNNQTLADVFDQLSAIYNVEIQYSREEINQMYFIGRIEKKDSLYKIIQDIALLNHLTVTSAGGKYIVRKQ